MIILFIATLEWRRIHKALSNSCNYEGNGYPHKDVLFWVDVLPDYTLAAS